MEYWATRMKSESHNLRQGECIAGTRKAYCAPKLRSFGPVGALTQSGSFTQMETGAANMMGTEFRA
jgi:hypothetical protein